MTYSFTCQEGHEPKTFTTEADNDDQAMESILEQMGPHVAEVHPDLAGKSPEELKQMVMDGWTKA
ncbi:MAG TPA: hypothetical protein VLE47_01415 [Candidatus Saccharimonadales bacterium]|nr:hypothetical protein [Candidatus Saccharimonadales bacterium]